MQSSSLGLRRVEERYPPVSNSLFRSLERARGGGEGNRKLGWSELEIRVTMLGFVFKLGDGPIWFRIQNVKKIYV